MGFFKFSRRQPAIGDAPALSDFIDRNAAFLAQKGIYEYSRARAGHYAKVLFREPEFLEAVERARWRAYPLGLAMVGELVEGVLRPYAAERHEQLDTLRELVLAVFDRYPVPPALGAPVWREARIELAQRMARVGLHPPKRAFEICEPWAETYFKLMPIHEKLRSSEFPTIRNYLRVTLCNIHDEFTKQTDVRALAETLRAQGAE